MPPFAPALACHELHAQDSPQPRMGGALLRRLRDPHNGAVSAEEIDRYLDALDEPKRTTLARLRQTILDILPEA
jgi:hypothetical protein